jgi:DNA-binding NtrC family response regulator
METSKMICVIDDDIIFQKMMNHHLTSMGFMVRSIFSSNEIENLVEKPHAILLDHHMDDATKNGLVLLKKLKKKMPEVPVIYMTSDTDKKLKENALRLGVFDFITKSSASLVILRTALDRIADRGNEKNWIRRIFN